MNNKNLVEEAKREIGKIIKDLNSTTACFTGHRSQKLPWGFNESDERCLNMKKKLRVEIEKAIARGYDTFICGMALGFDIICAETVLELKNTYPDIKMIGALPCRTQDVMWRESDRARYRGVLKRLDNVRCIYDEYVGAKCIFERNRFMVNNSSLMIALFDGQRGGTQSTIEYAKSRGLEIVIIQP